MKVASAAAAGSGRSGCMPALVVDSHWPTSSIAATILNAEYLLAIIVLAPMVLGTHITCSSSPIYTRASPPSGQIPALLDRRARFPEVGPVYGQEIAAKRRRELWDGDGVVKLPPDWPAMRDVEWTWGGRHAAATLHRAAARAGDLRHLAPLHAEPRQPGNHRNGNQRTMRAGRAAARATLHREEDHDAARLGSDSL